MTQMRRRPKRVTTAEPDEALIVLIETRARAIFRQEMASLHARPGLSEVAREEVRALIREAGDKVVFTGKVPPADPGEDRDRVHRVLLEHLHEAAEEEATAASGASSDRCPPSGAVLRPRRRRDD